ncbi:MAG: ribonuclease E activity regulator RraA [Xanthomonadales bacterium]|nr:ribonuclease E activity regulator RraA [Xanthomonadales bacterium]
MTTISTPDLCDEHPDVRVLEPVFRNYGGRAAFGGPVVTIKCYEDNSLVKSQAAEPGNGRVMVVDGGGSRRRALLGDMIAAKAAENGWAGLVIWGSVRDVDVLAGIDLGVQAIGAIPVKTEKRGLGDLEVPLEFCGVTVSPGDWIYADNNGVIVADRCLV